MMSFILSGHPFNFNYKIPIIKEGFLNTLIGDIIKMRKIFALDFFPYESYEVASLHLKIIVIL